MPNIVKYASRLPAVPPNKPMLPSQVVIGGSRLPVRRVFSGAVARRAARSEELLPRLVRRENQLVRSTARIRSSVDDWITDVPFEELTEAQRGFFSWLRKTRAALMKHPRTVMGASAGAVLTGEALLFLKDMLSAADDALDEIIDGRLSLDVLADIRDVLVKPALLMAMRSRRPGSWKGNSTFISFFSRLGDSIEQLLMCNDTSLDDVLDRFSFLGKDGALYVSEVLRALADSIEIDHGVQNFLDDDHTNAGSQLLVAQKGASADGDGDHAHVDDLDGSYPSKARTDTSDLDALESLDQLSEAENPTQRSAVQGGVTESVDSGDGSAVREHEDDRYTHGSDELTDRNHLALIDGVRRSIRVIRTILDSRSESTPVSFIDLINREII